MECYAEQYNLKSARGNSGESSICVATLADSFIGDNMKRIPLTQGQFALVDDNDYEWLNQYKWCATKGRYTYYAMRVIGRTVNRETILMHRLILNLKYGDKRQGDHRNRNGLDNQKHNLRICTLSQNLRNSGPRNNSRSKYKGVIWRGDRNRWVTEVNRKRYGSFINKIDAAKQYDVIVKQIHGEYAYLNFAEKGHESMEK